MIHQIILTGGIRSRNDEGALKDEIHSYISHIRNPGAYSNIVHIFNFYGLAVTHSKV